MYKRLSLDQYGPASVEYYVCEAIICLLSLCIEDVQEALLHQLLWPLQGMCHRLAHGYFGLYRGRATGLAHVYFGLCMGCAIGWHMVSLASIEDVPQASTYIATLPFVGTLASCKKSCQGCVQASPDCGEGVQHHFLITGCCTLREPAPQDVLHTSCNI